MSVYDFDVHFCCNLLIMPCILVMFTSKMFSVIHQAVRLSNSSYLPVGGGYTGADFYGNLVDALLGEGETPD